MTDAPERIWAQDAQPDECNYTGGGWWDDECGNTQYSHMVEYVRADLARPMTVAEAAKVLLDNTPNPTFDILKYPMIGEFKQSIAMQDEDGEEEWRDVTIDWTTIKEIFAAGLRALSQGGE